MKILLQCNLWMKESDCRYGLIRTLSRMDGVEFKHITLTQDLILVCKLFQPDVIISFKGGIPEELRGKCKTIQIYPDDPDEYDKAKLLVPQFDYFFTNSEIAKYWYWNEGFNYVKVCPFCTDHDFVKNIEFKKEYECDVIFAGNDNKKKYRYNYLNSLKDYNVQVYGKWNKPVHGFQNKTIFGKEYYTALKSAKIGVSFAISGAGFYNLKWSATDIVSVGTLMLVDYFSEMKNYFDYGKEIVGFTTQEDFLGKARYYLNHDEEREAIAKAGHERFLKDHTWEKRLEYIFKECDL